MTSGHGKVPARRANGSRAATAPAPDFLTGTAAKIRDYLQREAASVLEHQLAAGRLVLGVRAHSEYGEGGVEKLARILRAKTKFLYRLALRAGAFTPDDIQHAQEFAKENDYVLTASILDELAKIQSQQERRLQLERAIAGGWTVQRVRRELRGEPVQAQSTSNTLRLPKVAARAEALHQAITELGGTVETDDWLAADRNRAVQVLEQLCMAIFKTVRGLKLNAKRDNHTHQRDLQ